MSDETDGDAIRNLIASYCVEADAANASAWANLFDEEAPLNIGGAHQATGPEALHDWFVSHDMPRVTHMAANLRVELSGQSAQARADFITVDSKLAISTKGVYRASFVKKESGWKISAWHIDF